jgi:site-specific recombinase XerD
MMSFPATDSGQDWLAHLRRQGRSPHTIRASAQGLRHFTHWYATIYGAPFAPAEVMPRDVRDWKASQQTGEKAAPATLNQRLVAVTRFFHWVRTQGLCRENPAEGMSNLRLSPRQPKALDQTTLRTLWRAARGHLRDYALLEVLAGTGLRVGELLELQVGDGVMNERSGPVTVRKGKQDGYRVIPLTRDVRKALSAYLNQAHPDPHNPVAPLWVGPQGKGGQRGSVTRISEKYALQAGIEPVNPHALRHTFATRYLNANPGDLRGLARLLGHTSLDTVMIYTEPNLAELAERMEQVEMVDFPIRR